MDNPQFIRLHTREYGTLDYDPSVPCIIATHLGFATDEELKAMLDLGLAYAVVKKKYHSRIGWLANTSLTDGNTVGEWSATDWNPRLIAEGIYHLAFVLPKDVFAQMQINDYVTLSPKMKTASFESIEAAKEWLKFNLYNGDC
jgi:hypothetical protein